MSRELTVQVSGSSLVNLGETIKNTSNWTVFYHSNMLFSRKMSVLLKLLARYISKISLAAQGIVY